MIEVVSALLLRLHGPFKGRALLAQRPPTKDFPFSWECPGGKVEGKNESHHDALRRELAEELGIGCVGIGERAIACHELGPEDGVKEPIFQLFYPVIFEGEPKPAENQGLGWFAAHELGILRLTPGNKKALPFLVDHLSGFVRYEFRGVSASREYTQWICALKCGHERLISAPSPECGAPLGVQCFECGMEAKA